MRSEEKSKLALLGGAKMVTIDAGDMFNWPIITEEDEQAVLGVLRARKMSGLDISKQFETEFANWCGSKYALTAPNGTSAIQEAMFAVGVGVGDEIIGPSLTYWASSLQVYSLGGTVVFAEVDPETLCIDPDDIEHRITKRTKAIVVVHYLGYPCDMDRIMAIAEKHNIKVIEDVSHAQGSLYKGRMLGSIGHIGAMSLMTYKSFPIGEAGILVTNDRKYFERAVMFGHYLRQGEPGTITDPELVAIKGLPLGGYKNRLNQIVAAMGRVQIRYQKQRITEIDKAMSYFCDKLEGLPGIRTHRVKNNTGDFKGGWYCPVVHYVPEELGGLSATRFCEAVRAEGVQDVFPGTNKPLHLHPVFNTVDIYGHGKPTRIANSDRDLRQPKGSLPITEKIASRLIRIPHFRRYRPEVIDVYAEAFIKVCRNYKELLAGDKGGDEEVGDWNLSRIGR